MTRVLIVEDELIVARDIEGMLIELGYQVPAIVSSGEEAIATAEQLEPDLVLMDIHLRGAMDGIAAAVELRRRVRVPVIFLTSYSDEATLARSKQAAPSAYLIKPFNARDLRSHIEVALHRHGLEVQLAEAQALAGLGSCRVDRRTGQTTYSDTTLAIFGFAPGEQPSREDLFARTHPEDLERMVKVSAEGWRTGQGFRTDVRAQRPDGTTVDIEVRTTFETDGQGTVIAANAVFLDITERKALERLKNEFVSMVSHELRTPLTSIRGALGLLDAGLAGELPQEAADMVRVAHQNSERLIRLVNDILDLDKIAAGKLELALVNLDVRRLLQTAAEGMRALAQQRDIRITTEIRARGAIRGDSDRVAQVLANLLSNAIKYSPEGGTIVLRAVPGSAPGRVRIAVRDQGPGIPADRRHLLFGKFQQLDSSDRRRRGGSGLGLAISKSIVEQHGGEIGVDSQDGRGSEFWFELPARTTGGELDVLAADRQVLLVVIADELQRARAENVLGAAGFIVAMAPDLETAERFARRVRPAVAMVDETSVDGRAAIAALTPLLGRRPLLAIGDLPVDSLPALARRSLRPPGRTRVLIVDDDESSRRLLMTQLEPLAVDCRCAGDGLTAVAMAREFVPDLIVLDLELPGADGFQVVDVLRQENLRTTALMVYTVRDLTSTDRQALTLGPTRHLTKTRVSAEELRATASDLITGIVPSARALS